MPASDTHDHDDNRCCCCEEAQLSLEETLHRGEVWCFGVHTPIIIQYWRPENSPKPCDRPRGLAASGVSHLCNRIRESALASTGSISAADSLDAAAGKRTAVTRARELREVRGVNDRLATHDKRQGARTGAETLAQPPPCSPPPTRIRASPAEASLSSRAPRRTKRTMNPCLSRTRPVCLRATHPAWPRGTRTAARSRPSTRTTMASDPTTRLRA